MVVVVVVVVGGATTTVVVIPKNHGAVQDYVSGIERKNDCFVVRSTSVVFVHGHDCRGHCHLARCVVQHQDGALEAYLCVHTYSSHGRGKARMTLTTDRAIQPARLDTQTDADNVNGVTKGPYL